MSSERFDTWEHEARWARDEVRFDSVRFFRNAKEIISLYDVWGKIDRFYFIPIKPRLMRCYRLVKMTDEEICLGTFVRCLLEHAELFMTPCPECGRRFYPYGYLGSSATGGVQLHALCPCEEKGGVIHGDWGIWCGFLRETQRADEKRLKRARLFHPGFKPATVESLIGYLWEEKV